MDAVSLDWVVFDLNGTLLDPAGLAAELPPPLCTEATGLALLDDSVLQAMADTLVGGYRPFSEYLRAAVNRRLHLAGANAASDHAERALAAAARLPAYPEVAQALESLRSAGLRIATITNSPRKSAESALHTAGLSRWFEVVVGSDDARSYKPAPAVYRTGLERIGTEPARACMVAAHGWDVHGANAVGMRTGWVSRKELRLLETYPAPDLRGGDVAEVSSQLVARR